jgi:hypothetical protein
MFSFFSKNKKRLYAPLTSEQDAFLATCTREYNEKLEKLNRDWSFSNYKRWGFDQFSGVFFLELHDGSRVEADGQLSVSRPLVGVPTGLSIYTQGLGTLLTNVNRPPLPLITGSRE